jgi:hypothetical protein
MVYMAIDDENLKRFEFEDPMELLEEIIVLINYLTDCISY